MKKLFLFLILFLSIFLNTIDIYALELTENSSPDEIIQAMREAYPDVDKKDFVLFKHNTMTLYQYWYIDELLDGYKFGVKKTTFGYFDEKFYSSKSINYITFNINNNPQLGKFSSSSLNLSQFTILYSSIDIPNSDGTVYFEKNYSFSTDPDPTPTPTPTPDNVELPFTREEFLLIPFSVFLLIIMLFLKWCFPFKGGKNL